MQRRHLLLAGTTAGTVSDSLSYNGFGEVTAYSASYNGTALLAIQYSYDPLGRITQKIETLGGSTDMFDYGYDRAGRLVEVKKNGATAASYNYDANGNRLSKTAGGVTVNGTYDAQDRLTQYDGTTYSYTANGELVSKANSGQTTTYQYDVLGNLKRVTPASGPSIDYVIDGANRRIGKKVNDTLVQGFLYQDQLKPIAELDGNDNLVSRFVYATHINVPDYLIKGGAIYRIITDHLGSPRLVVDTATGTIAHRMDYDEFGNVLTDTNPGFQPFGFAGGIYDPDTRLVRFGARDYDAETGRWTAKDRIFSNNPINLYVYARNNPIGFIDPLGLDEVKVKVGAGDSPVEAGYNIMDGEGNVAVVPVSVGPLKGSVGINTQGDPYVEAGCNFKVGGTKAGFGVKATAILYSSEERKPSQLFKIDVVGWIKANIGRILKLGPEGSKNLASYNIGLAKEIAEPWQQRLDAITGRLTPEANIAR